METIKSFLMLALVIFLTIILSAFIAWYFALAAAIFIVAVAPPIINIFYFQNRKLKNLPDVNEMPDLILERDDVTDWEREFCLDMKQKFGDDKFVDNISKKQCRKLLEVYLERVRNIPEKEIDVSNIKISLGGRKIQ